MPFQRIKQAVADSPVPEPHQQIRPKDETVLESSILNKRKPSPDIAKPSRLKPFLWALPVAATLVIGMGAFFVIDRNAKISSIQEAERVLRDVQPSEYLTDSQKISRANSRNVMMTGKSNGGKMGDKLGRDLFR